MKDKNAVNANAQLKTASLYTGLHWEGQYVRFRTKWRDRVKVINTSISQPVGSGTKMIPDQGITT
jgi:hypothetical protein